MSVYVFLDMSESMEYANVGLHNNITLDMPFSTRHYTYQVIEQPPPPPQVVIDPLGRQNSINFTLSTLSSAVVK